MKHCLYVSVQLMSYDCLKSFCAQSRAHPAFVCSDVELILSCVLESLYSAQYASYDAKIVFDSTLVYFSVKTRV